MACGTELNGSALRLLAFVPPGFAPGKVYLFDRSHQQGEIGAGAFRFESTPWPGWSIARDLGLHRLHVERERKTWRAMAPGV